MRYDTEKGRDENRYMDWQIAGTKAAVCGRRAKENWEKGQYDAMFYWLELWQCHTSKANALLHEVDRVRSAVADVAEYVGAQRIG